MQLLLAGLVFIGLAQEAGTSPKLDDARGVPAISFVQEVTGRPGSPDETKQIQRVVLSADRVWLLDEQRRLIQILRADRNPAVLWEVSADLNRYREITDLSRIQKDRWIQERQFVKRLADLPESEREELLKAAHIRIDSKGELIREVSLENLGETKQEDGRTLKRVKVFENGRLVADLWLADMEIPFSLAALHGATGAFGPEVLEVVRDLKGFPVSGTIHVVTATLTHPLEFKISEIEDSPVANSFFELPEGCEKEEQRAFLNCPICGSEVERESSAARARDREGRWIFFKSRECFSEWKRQRKARQ
ncbi:MAG: hypothetical protein CBC13_03155 [Planctomycetia bacterium TMED53]|nr:MAG: hypothetical protein CBC13_03155 [Planctomycetia bacterium TMED53]